MVLGERTLKQAVQSNKVRVAALFVIFLSLAINVFTLPRLVIITQQHLELMRQYKELNAHYLELKAKQGHMAAPREEPSPLKDSQPLPARPLVLPHPPSQSEEEKERQRMKKLRQNFERMRHKEDLEQLNPQGSIP